MPSSGGNAMRKTAPVALNPRRTFLREIPGFPSMISVPPASLGQVPGCQYHKLFEAEAGFLESAVRAREKLLVGVPLPPSLRVTEKLFHDTFVAALALRKNPAEFCGTG